LHIGNIVNTPLLLLLVTVPPTPSSVALFEGLHAGASGKA
jgi:hypothetical protein